MLNNKIIIKKLNKHFKLELESTKLIATGVLGKIEYNLGKNCYLVNNQLFLKKKKIDLFFKQLVNYLYYSVTKGWYIELKLNGLGYKCFKQDNQLSFDIGYSVLLNFVPNEKIKVKIFKNKIIFSSIDRIYLMKLVNTLAKYAVPNPYKGKGIIINNKKIILKKKARR